ncbi:MAG: HoxN/HupN/NixA family nickel/cobalt transporter, partial [uncultured Gemmatimonadaceae bacterium]
ALGPRARARHQLRPRDAPRHRSGSRGGRHRDRGARALAGPRRWRGRALGGGAHAHDRRGGRGDRAVQGHLHPARGALAGARRRRDARRARRAQPARRARPPRPARRRPPGGRWRGARARRVRRGDVAGAPADRRAPLGRALPPRVRRRHHRRDGGDDGADRGAVGVRGRARRAAAAHDPRRVGRAVGGVRPLPGAPRRLRGRALLGDAPVDARV